MKSPFEILSYGCVQVQIQVSDITDESMRVYLSEQTTIIEEGMASGPPYDKAVILIDASVELIPSATVRRMQADWTNAHQHQLEKIVHAMGFVVPSALSRGAMTAVLWLSRPKWPMIAHASLPKAVDWALLEAERMGGEVHADLVAGKADTVVRDRAQRLAS